MTTDDFTAKQEYGFYLDGALAAGLPSVVGESLTGFVERIEAEAVRAAMAKLVEKVRALPEPTLGLKGGVNREAVLHLIEEEAP